MVGFRALNMKISFADSGAIEWTGIVTTILSVILGAILAYLATFLSERRKERRESIARATLLFLRSRKIIDGIFKIDRQLNEGIAKAIAGGVGGPVWTQFEEIPNIHQYEEAIPVEETAILVLYNELELLESISELEEGYNSIIRALSKIFEMKTYWKTLVPPFQVVGNVASSNGPLSPEASVLYAQLCALGDDIVRHLGLLKSRARETAPLLHKALKRGLKVKKFLSIVLPPGSS